MKGLVMYRNPRRSKKEEFEKGGGVRHRLMRKKKKEVNSSEQLYKSLGVRDNGNMSKAVGRAKGNPLGRKRGDEPWSANDRERGGELALCREKKRKYKAGVRRYR